MSHLVVINKNKYMAVKIIKKYYDKQTEWGRIAIILCQGVLLN